MGIFGKPKVRDDEVSKAAAYWPDLGQTVGVILTEAGYTSNEIAQLASEAAVLGPEDSRNPWSGAFALCVQFVLERVHMVVVKAKGKKAADAALDAWNDDGMDSMLRQLIGELGTMKVAGYGQALSEDLARNRPALVEAIRSSFPH